MHLNASTGLGRWEGGEESSKTNACPQELALWRNQMPQLTVLIWPLPEA